MTQTKTHFWVLGLLLLAFTAQGQEASPLYVKPLVNLKAVSSGLSHQGVTVLKSEGNRPRQELGAPTLPIGSELIIRLEMPKGFKKENGLIYFGTSIKVTDPSTDRVLADLEDVYKTDAQGYKPEHLKSLTANLAMNRGDYGEVGDRIAIEVAFFDKKSSGSVAVELSSLTLTPRKSNMRKEEVFVKSPGYIISNNLTEPAAGTDGKDFIDDIQLYAESAEGLKPLQQLKQPQNGQLVMSVSSDLPLVGEINGKTQWRHWDGELIAEQKFELSGATAGKARIMKAPKTEIPLEGLYLLTGTMVDEEGKGASVQAWIVCGQPASSLAQQQVAGELTELAMFYRKSGFKELSYSMLSTALEVYSASAENLYQQGKFYEKDGSIDQAITYFEQALLADSAYFDAHLAVGMAYKSQRAYGDALEHLQICSKLNPGHYQALYQTGWLNNQRGRYKEALEVLDQATRHNNKMDAEVYYERGFANLKLEKYKAAALDFEKFTTLAPNDFRGFFEKGTVYLKLKDYERAVKALSRATKLDSYSYDAFYELGYGLLKMQQYEEAISKYDKAMELAEGTRLMPNILWQKAVCLIALGKNAEACPLLEKSVKEGREEAVKLQKEYCN